MIGREREQKILAEALESNRAEMIAVYGRRRIGKTYLVEQFYKQDRVNMVSLIGQANANMSTQLNNANRASDKEHNSLMLVMLTTYGLKRNQYSNIVNSELEMESLFQ